MINITLSYADGSTWNAGTFADQASADLWVSNEKAQPRWNPTTQALYTTLVTAPTAQQVAVANAQAYLASTDWQVIRLADNGIPIDADVKTKRQAARLVINPTGASSAVTTGS